MVKIVNTEHWQKVTKYIFSSQVLSHNTELRVLNIAYHIYATLFIVNKSMILSAGLSWLTEYF